MLLRQITVAIGALSLIGGIVLLADAQTGMTIAVGPQNIQSVPGSSAGLAPFMRSGDPFFFDAGTTPAQTTVNQPPNTTSYRLVNPCGVDIRIKSVASMTSTVGPMTGTRFLARTAETMASTANPLGATAIDRIISVWAVSDPGAAGCTIELTYGNGG
jgi:hypothetical protein